MPETKKAAPAARAARATRATPATGATPQMKKRAPRRPAGNGAKTIVIAMIEMKSRSRNVVRASSR
jgi:hypothetical protein